MKRTIRKNAGALGCLLAKKATSHGLSRRPVAEPTRFAAPLVGNP
jgi:hypothetical protein